jgi:hypothetical protein
MTGYHISIGYNSGGPINAWELLVEAVEEVCAAPGHITAEVKRETLEWKDEELHDYVYRYKARDDQTLTITPPDPDDDKDGEVMQLAGGGGEGRRIKEAVRRAFSRLVILKMHKLGIEVNLVVA